VLKAVELEYPRHLSEEMDRVSRALGSTVGVRLFLDYDGTLVSGPRDAPLRPSEGVLEKLRRLCEAEEFSVFIISSRSVEELRLLVDVPGLGFIGRRGFEIAMPGLPVHHPVEKSAASELIHRIELEMSGLLDSASEARLENRGYSVVLHTPGSAGEAGRKAVQRLAELVKRLDTARILEMLYGDSTVEVGIAGWSKGDVLSHMLADADPDIVLTIYVGDDVTDEDAFAAVALWSNENADTEPWFMVGSDGDDEYVSGAITVLVTDKPRASLASLFVRDIHEVHEFLSSLSAIAAGVL
jgi:trehalose-phosphatase